jgi:leucyl/phenylalanyl-tRNA---protein transferase
VAELGRRRGHGPTEPRSRRVEPRPTRWLLPSASDADEVGVVGVGADLEPGTLLAAYRNGLFPMPMRGVRRIAWWSPDPRGILPLDGLQVTRSLRRSCRRYEVRTDTAFDQVIRACAEPSRDGGWINRAIIDAYTRLHELGWAHSVEAWDEDGLAGGLYGVAIGGLFAGESMFHRATDASKVALVALVERLGVGGAALLDVQWSTPHLASLGVVEVPRPRYLALLAEAVVLDVDAFAEPDPETSGGSGPVRRPERPG